MPMLMIKCPATQTLIPTGIDMPKSAFESGTFTNNKTSCPVCGQSHTWSKGDIAPETWVS